jgi:curved DNA-binding protein
LSNTVNRKKYDEYGENWQHADEFEKSKDNKGNKEVVNKEVLAVCGGNGGDYPIFFESMFVVVLVVVAEALNIKARTLTLNCTLI